MKKYLFPMLIPFSTFLLIQNCESCHSFYQTKRAHIHINYRYLKKKTILTTKVQPSDKKLMIFLLTSYSKYILHV